MRLLKLEDICFPVYSLSKNYEKIYTEFNILYIQTASGTYVLDNKNMNGNTLGERRAKIENTKLYKPKKTCYSVAQLLKCKSNIFIDNIGTVFKYKKTKYVPLKYHKILSIHYREKFGDYFLLVKDIFFPIVVNYREANTYSYAGILHTPTGYILYELSEDKKPDTKRKI